MASPRSEVCIIFEKQNMHEVPRIGISAIATPTSPVQTQIASL